MIPRKTRTNVSIFFLTSTNTNQGRDMRERPPL